VSCLVSVMSAHYAVCGECHVWWMVGVVSGECHVWSVVTLLFVQVRRRRSNNPSSSRSGQVRSSEGYVKLLSFLL